MSVEAEVSINKLTWPLFESLSSSRHFEELLYNSNFNNQIER